MIRNNYDTSSTGWECVLCAFYDADRGRNDFEDCFHVIQHDSYSQSAVYQYVGYEEHDPITDALDLFDFSGCSAKDFREALFDWHMSSGTPYWTPTVRNFFEEHGWGKDADWEASFKDALSSNYTVYEWARDEELDLIDKLLNVKPKFRVHQSRGFCQGDFAYVIVPLSEGWEGTDEMIDRLIWQPPVFARLEVLGPDGEEHELYLEEALTDDYSWDRDEVVKWVEAYRDSSGDPLPEAVLEWVRENTPETIDYV